MKVVTFAVIFITMFQNNLWAGGEISQSEVSSGSSVIEFPSYVGTPTPPGSPQYGGPRVGGFGGYPGSFEGNPRDREFYVWCDDILRNMWGFRSQASFYMRSGDYQESINVLLSGLERESYQYGRVDPLSISLMRYAFEMGSLLNRYNKDPQGQKATIVALESFYDLIVVTANEVDYLYYECTSGYGPRGRRDCAYSRVENFETRVLQAVSDMLSLVNDSLLVERGNFVYPIGRSDIYLQAAAVVSGAADNELRKLIYAAAYSCEILDLSIISASAAGYSQPNQPAQLKAHGVGEVYHGIEYIIESMQSEYNCY